MDFECMLFNYVLSLAVLGWLPCPYLRPFVISALSCNKLIFGSGWLCYGHVNLMFELLQIMALLLLLPQARFWLFFYQLNSAETFSLICPCCIVAVLCRYFFRYGWLNSTKLSITLCRQTAYLTKTCFCMLNTLDIVLTEWAELLTSL